MASVVMCVKKRKIQVFIFDLNHNLNANYSFYNHDLADFNLINEDFENISFILNRLQTLDLECHDSIKRQHD